MHLLHVECQAARASYACAFLRLGIQRCCGTGELGQGYTVQSGAMLVSRQPKLGPAPQVTSLCPGVMLPMLPQAR